MHAVGAFVSLKAARRTDALPFQAADLRASVMVKPQ
jgi:hypothetical protein